VRHWYTFSACGICVFFKAMLHHIKKCIEAATRSKLQDENWPVVEICFTQSYTCSLYHGKARHISVANCFVLKVQVQRPSKTSVFTSDTSEHCWRPEFFFGATVQTSNMLFMSWWSTYTLPIFAYVKIDVSPLLQKMSCGDGNQLSRFDSPLIIYWLK
jgi:hypothetical protein